MSSGGRVVSERSMWLAALAIALSAVVHIGILVAVSDLIFSSDMADESSRRRFQDRHPMNVVRMDNDPLSEFVRRGGAEIEAPKVDRSESEKLDRLSPDTDDAMIAPDDSAVKVAEVRPLGKAVEESIYRHRMEVLEITVPTVKNEESTLPRRLAPKIARVKTAEDVVPAVDLMPALQIPSGFEDGVPLRRVAAPSAAIGDGMLGKVDFATAGEEAVKSLVSDFDRKNRERQLENAKAAAERFTDKMLDAVDESLVAREKAAVAGLRDVAIGSPFAKFVETKLQWYVAADDPAWKYFEISISPRRDQAGKEALPVVAKDIAFLIDSSGSIGSDRIKAVSKCVKTLLRTLNSGDRFNLVSFRNNFEYAFPTWMQADRVSFAMADAWLDSLTANGTTDVFAVMRSMMAMPRDPKRPIVAVMITDGEATAGLTETSRILGAFEDLNGGLISVYTYGVKRSANAFFIDMISQGNRGGAYIHTGLRMTTASSLPDFNDRFRYPVLSDLALTFSTASQVEAYPKYVSNLYRGGEITVYGRCPVATKELCFSIRALSGAKAFDDIFTLEFTPEGKSNSVVRNKWAKGAVRARILAFSKAPSAAKLSELRSFAERYGVPVPYEKNLEEEIK